MSLGPVKSFKNFFVKLFLNANSVIRHTNGHLSCFVAPDSDIDLVSSGRIFDRIGEYVNDDLPNPIFVGMNSTSQIVIQIDLLRGLCVKNILYHVNQKVIDTELFQV